MSHINYIGKQTGRNLAKTWGTQIMTLVTVALSILIFAFFFLVYSNMVKAGKRLGDELRLTIYMENEVAPQLQPVIEKRIRDYSDVEKIVFVSRQEAFNRLTTQLGSEKDVLDDLGPSFLPPSIEIYPKKTLHDLSHLTQFADYLTTLPGALKVQYGQEWVKRFGYFTNLLTIIMFLSGGLLILTTTFIVSYMIRLTVATREAELEILRLLGASSAYIRTPLFIEGLIQGLLGTSLGLIFLYVLFQWIKVRFSGPGLLSVMNFTFFSPLTTTLILLAGITLCAAGSLVSIRKFLRI